MTLNLERIRYVDQLMVSTDWSCQPGDATAAELQAMLAWLQQSRLELIKAADRFGGPPQALWRPPTIDQLEQTLLDLKRHLALLCLELARWDSHGPYLGIQGAQQLAGWVLERAAQLMDLSFEELGDRVAAGPPMRVG